MKSVRVGRVPNQLTTDRLLGVSTPHESLVKIRATCAWLATMSLGEVRGIYLIDPTH